MVSLKLSLDEKGGGGTQPQQQCNLINGANLILPPSSSWVVVIEEPPPPISPIYSSQKKGKVGWMGKKGLVLIRKGGGGDRRGKKSKLDFWNDGDWGEENCEHTLSKKKSF